MGGGEVTAVCPPPYFYLLWLRPYPHNHTNKPNGRSSEEAVNRAGLHGFIYKGAVLAVHLG
jgi:hypothetical protein